MPLYRDVNTNIVSDLPENIGTHRVLGKNLEPYTPEFVEYEEDKVVDETAVSTQRLHKTAKRITEPVIDFTDSRDEN